MHDPARLHVSRFGNPKAPPLEPTLGAEQPSASMATLLQASHQLRSNTSTSAPSPVIPSSPGALVDTASPAPSSVPAT